MLRNLISARSVLLQSKACSPIASRFAARDIVLRPTGVQQPQHFSHMIDDNDLQPLTFSPLHGRAGGHPKIECPIKPKMNPHIADAERRSLQWVVDMKIAGKNSSQFKTFAVARFPLLGGRCFCNLSKEQLEVTIDFMALLFYLDDYCDSPVSQEEVHKSNIRTLEDRLIALRRGDFVGTDDHPLIVSFAGVYERLLKDAHPSWIERFYQNMKFYLQGLRWERHLRLEKSEPIMSTFRRVRYYAGAVNLAIDVAGVFLRDGSSTDILNCVYIRQLLEMAVNYVLWTNDVYSLNKEVWAGVTNNIVVVIARRRNLSWLDAIDAAIVMVNEEMDAFRDLERKLPDLREPLDYDTAIYIDNLKNWMRGNLDWSEESGRYAQ